MKVYNFSVFYCCDYKRKAIFSATVGRYIRSLKKQYGKKYFNKNASIFYEESVIQYDKLKCHLPSILCRNCYSDYYKNAPKGLIIKRDKPLKDSLVKIDLKVIISETCN